MSMTTAPLPTVPLYFAPSDQTTTAAIAARVLAAVNAPTTIDTGPFALLGQMVNAFALELSQLPAALQLALNDTFMSTTADMTRAAARGLEKGLQPNPATFATGAVTIAGAAGLIIPDSTRVAVPAVGTTPSILFSTIGLAVIATGQTSVSVGVIAVSAGSSSNVAAGAISMLVDSVSGAGAITNPAPTSGGEDAETLAAFVARYIAFVTAPLTGENLATYQTWAEEVAGIGGALAVRTWNGPGTVGVYVADETNAPAASSLILAAENSIINPWRVTEPAHSLTIGGLGVSTDSSQAGARQTPDILFQYNAGGAGTLTLARLDTLLTQPGIWRIRPRLKIGGTIGTGNLLQITVNDLSTAAIAHTAPSGGTAQVTFTAAQLTTGYQGDDAGTDPYGLDVYWNGIDQLQLVITRLITDTTTEVWLDEILFQSTMPNDTPGVLSLQSAADRVTILPAQTVSVAVVITGAVWTPGTTVSAGEAAVQAAIQSYLATLRFAAVSTIVWGRVVAAALNATVSGQTALQTFTSLTVNGGTTDVTIQTQQVPVLTVPITWS